MQHLTILTTLAERLRDDEDGQGAVEYVGIVIVVIAIIAAVAALAPQVGTTIIEGLQNIVEGFVGG